MEQHQEEIKGNNNRSQCNIEPSSSSSSASSSSSSFYTSESENDFYTNNHRQRQQHFQRNRRPLVLPENRPRPATFVVFENKLLFPEIIVLGRTRFHRFIFLKILVAIFYLGDYGVSVEEINNFFEFLLLTRKINDFQCNLACKVKIIASKESIIQCINSKYHLNPDMLHEINSTHYQKYINSKIWFNDVYNKKYPQNIYECLVIHTELINSVLMQNPRGKNSLKMWLVASSSSCPSAYYRRHYNSNISIRNAMQWINNMEQTNTTTHQPNLKSSNLHASITSKSQLCQASNNINNNISNCTSIEHPHANEEENIKLTLKRKKKGPFGYNFSRRRIVIQKKL